MHGAARHDELQRLRESGSGAAPTITSLPPDASPSIRVEIDLASGAVARIMRAPPSFWVCYTTAARERPAGQLTPGATSASSRRGCATTGFWIERGTTRAGAKRCYPSLTMSASAAGLSLPEVIFLVEEAPEGGFTARALGESIFTEADDLADLHAKVCDAIYCHFDEGKVPEAHPAPLRTRGSHQRLRLPRDSPVTISRRPSLISATGSLGRPAATSD